MALARLDQAQIAVGPNGIPMRAPRPSTTSKAKVRTKRRDLIVRYGLVRAWEASAFVIADSQHGSRERKSSLRVELRGDLTLPIKNVAVFNLFVFPETEPMAGGAAIPSVGSIVSMRQVLDAVVPLSDREFQLLVAMATAGRLASVRMCFQEPKYGRALIASCSFDTKLPDDE